MAGSEAAKEAIYLSSFLRELGMDLSQPPPLKLDNKSAIDLAYIPEHHSKTKHIERCHYFIRECVENGKLRVPFVPTKENSADFFTKPLSGKAFFDLRDKVMNVPRDRPIACTVQMTLSVFRPGSVDGGVLRTTRVITPDLSYVSVASYCVW